LQFTYFRRDSVKFLLLADKKDEAETEIKRIYKDSEEDGKASLIALCLVKSVQK